MASAPALALANVHAGYRTGADILCGIDLDVAPGETVAILGPSGGGKSTLLKVIAGLVPVRSGTVEVLGVARPRAPPRGSIGYIPQRLGLVRHASALDNVLQGGLHTTPAWRSLVRRPAPDLVERAHEALASVGLDGLADAPVVQLSGGQQRRVAIARALVQQPRILLADEFLGELDPHTVDTVLAAVRRLTDDAGTTTIFVEHHLDQARRIADHVHRVQDGHLGPLGPLTTTHGHDPVEVTA